MTTFRYDSVIYGNILGARSPGTHNLHIIEEADHNFTNVTVSSRFLMAFMFLTAPCIPETKRDRKYHPSMVG
jgi:hypothetical protein